MWTDSASALAVSKNPVHHQRSKHIHMKFTWSRDEVARGSVIPAFTTSATNCADICTKSVSQRAHKNHFSTVMGRTSIPRTMENIIEIQDDSLPCPICSQGLYHK